MSPRKSPEPDPRRSTTTSLRFSAVEMEAIRAQADALGLSPSALMRRATLDALEGAQDPLPGELEGLADELGAASKRLRTAARSARGRKR